MGRGDRRKVRWRNDRVRKKHGREKRRRHEARPAEPDGEASGQNPNPGPTAPTAPA
ncbi:MAG: hypothetical protein ACRD0A_06130 [Acidimicrobiales bacterium]